MHIILPSPAHKKRLSVLLPCLGLCPCVVGDSVTTKEQKKKKKRERTKKRKGTYIPSAAFTASSQILLDTDESSEISD